MIAVMAPGTVLTTSLGSSMASADRGMNGRFR
jgi:hypothetical protein